MDEDLFKLWGLDALWRYNSPQQLVAVNRSIAEDFETSVQEIIPLPPRFTGEWASRDLQKQPQAERKPWWRFWRN